MSDTPPRPRFARNVLALTAVSFFTDASSEIIAPLLPLFLASTLGASSATIGLIEGAAETTASVLKLASGWWSDRVARRKPLVVAGYALASLVRPLVAIAQSSAIVLIIRLTDRVGKGIRGAPRDALIADSVAPEQRGRAFGFQRTGDHAGAVVGPLIAVLCLQFLGMPVRHVFWVAAIPGALAVLVAVLFVQDVPRASAKADLAQEGQPLAQNSARPGQASPKSVASSTPFDRRFRGALLAIFVFTLGNSTDAFLLLRAHQLGVTVAQIPLLWALLHGVKSATSAPSGALSDRVGRRPLMLAGWLLYALLYAAFGKAVVAWQAWALFAAYGVVFGLTEGTEKSLIADLVPADRRGTAFGWYNLTIGVGALPASLLFGVVWDRAGAPIAFAMGASLAVLASMLLVLFVPRRTLGANLAR